MIDYQANIERLAKQLEIAKMENDKKTIRILEKAIKVSKDNQVKREGKYK